MRSGPFFFFAVRSLIGRKRGKKNSAHPKDRSRGSKKELSAQGGGMAGAILGIGISLVPLILVLVVSDGMIQGITRRYVETKTYHVQVALPDRMGASEMEEGLSAIRSVAGVESVFLEMNGSAVAVSAKASNAVLIRAVEPSFFEDTGTKQYLKLVQGKMTPEGSREIVIGSSLASILHVQPGDQVTLITPNQTAAAAGGASDFSSYAPRLSFFKVVGIVNAGYHDLDALWAFVSPAAGARLLVYPSCYSFFGIKVDDPYSNSLGSIRNEVAGKLEEVYPDWFDPYLARSWPEIEKSLYKSFGTTKSMLLFIMGIALLVAAVNLGSSLFTFVVEHSMDIAVLRSVGAADAAIRRIFVGAGLITGSLGTLLGLLIGLLLSWNVNALIAGLEWIVNIFYSAIAALSGRPSVALRLLDPEYYLERIPIAVDFGQIAAIAALSIILSAVASLIPARKASRISVLELIRKS